MKICLLADTHGFHERIKVPDAQVVIFAGDMSMSGTFKEIAAFAHWWRALLHPHKVVIAGNHDWLFQRNPGLARSLLPNTLYLEDSEASVAGLRIWGSPWQPWFLDWAFNLQRGAQIRAKWDIIPKGIDILVTHGPPQGRCDRVTLGENVGCADLLSAIQTRIKPHWHVFGHIHEGYGMIQEGRTAFINASVCDASYQPVNKPLVLEI